MTVVCDFITQDFARSDLIALGALLVSLLSAFYASRQVEEARKARQTAIKESLRTQGLELFRSANNFCAFCCRYYTLYLMKTVNGTRDLVRELHSFSWQVEQAGPLDMPEVEAVLKDLTNMAWRLQRALDRFGHKGVADSGVGESEVEELVDQFAHKQRALQEAFKPYLDRS